MLTEHGGPGANFLYNVVITEEPAAPAGRNSVHSDMVASYILSFGARAEAEVAARNGVGEIVGAIGLTEPGGGSDLKDLRTRAVRDGDDYVINGQKTYISNGQLCDLVVLACKTNPDAGAKGVSLVVVETSRSGFQRGRRLEKLGLKAQDTSELFFNDVRVPVANRLAEEGAGFKMAMHKLAHERLIIAVNAVATCEAVLEWTVSYTRERKAFGKPIAEFQNTRFKVAEMTALVQGARVFVDRCIELGVENQLDSTDAAMAKMVASGSSAGRRRVPAVLWRLWLRSTIRSRTPTSTPASGASLAARPEVMREIVSRKVFQD